MSAIKIILVRVSDRTWVISLLNRAFCWVKPWSFCTDETLEAKHTSLCSQDGLSTASFLAWALTTWVCVGEKMKMSLIHGEKWSYIWVKSSESPCDVTLSLYWEEDAYTKETSPGKKQGHFRSLGRKTTESIPTVMMSVMTTGEEEHSCLNVWQIIHENTHRRMRNAFKMSVQSCLQLEKIHLYHYI